MKMKNLLLVVLSVCVFPTAALAEWEESPQFGAFELKFGPYRPAVDKNPSLAGSPYADTFNNDTMFLTTLEVDWQFWHPPGFSLAIGGSWGFMQEYARAVIEDDAGNTSPAADYTVLNVMPFAVLAIARIDVLADKLGIPVVPFVKFGLNWYLWWVHKGGEISSVTDENGSTQKAVGATPGYQFNLGAMLRLDQFDKMSARTFDNEAGVNHSYLFAEMTWAVVDRFGNNDYMNLSTDTFANATIMFGLALEF